MTILKNAFPLMIQQPSVADPDRQFRRVRESFTAELFLLLSREMRKDRSSQGSSSPRRPESATVAPLICCTEHTKASTADLSGKRAPWPDHPRPPPRQSKLPRPFFFETACRENRSSCYKVLPIPFQTHGCARTCCCTFICSRCGRPASTENTHEKRSRPLG